jgi:hypothetical protein
MSNTNTMVSYLAKVTELRDQLVSIGTKVEDKELVSIALNGLAPSWKPFVQGVCACENLPNYESFGITLCKKRSRLESCLVEAKGSRRPSPHWEDEEGKQERIQEG